MMILNWLMYHLHYKSKKENYRLISISPQKSKVFERILYKQVDTFMIIKLSPYLCGFRKNLNAQYSPMKMIETWTKKFG